MAFFDWMRRRFDVIAFPMLILVLCSAVAWLGVLLVPWRPWSTRERIAPLPGNASGAGDDRETPVAEVTVLIPARNEAAVIGQTLAGLRSQQLALRVIVIDDQSTDETSQIAREALDSGCLEIVQGAPLPESWSGKLWALEQGSQRVNTDFVLLLDADIELLPRILQALVDKIVSEKLDLVSVMAELRMVSIWEKLLVPAFVYFFKLLYPFSLSNDPKSRIAAAAGGCILLRTEALRKIGGFAAIRGALIDDCTLARRVKESGGRTWLGLSHEVRSHRPYPDLASLWNMVARNAFTQLHYSIALLALTTALMILLFWMPLAGLFSASAAVAFVSLTGLLAMMGAYLPSLRFHGRSPFWALALPGIGTLYLLMTWSSAIRYWQGRRSEWKGRIYTKATAES